MRCRSIRAGGLALSTLLKLNSLLRVELIARMGREFVMEHVFHRFKSVFIESGTVLFRQGDAIQETSPIYILANGRVKVLVDPQFRARSDSNEEIRLAATSEAAGCR
jgi:CRP-like cAMP-binding protein